MIIFIPSWGKLSNRGLSIDDLVGQVRVVKDSGTPYKLLIGDYIPNLRYFLHRYDLLEADYESLFDLLQGFDGLEQRRVNLDDLDFPLHSEFLNTPNGIFVYFNEQKIGEISFGEGGHLQSVKYFNSSLLQQVDFYDDRGVLSSRKVLKERSLKGYHYYLDLKGDWIFREDIENGKCMVNLDNPSNLMHETYPNLGAIQFELIEKYIEKIEDVKQVILAATDNNIPSLYQSSFLSETTLSFFEQRYTFPETHQSFLPFLLEGVNSIVVESNINLDHVSLYTPQKIHRISPFDTRFELSISQEVKDEVIYFETRYLSDEQFLSFLNPLFSYLYEAPDSELMHRSFKLLFRVTDTHKNDLKALVSNFISQRFPEALAEIDLFEKEQLINNAINDEKVTLSWEAQRIKNISNGINFLTVHHEEALFEVLHEARIIIDLSEAPDLFTQIAGISAGIPQINLAETEYIISGENGLVVSDETQFHCALAYYLEGLEHWQEARAYAVQQIRKYSGHQLFLKIKNIMEED